jgi:ABC-type methionine transport system ATPase subunit
MPTRTLRLNYPPSLLRQPILNQLIVRFELTVNILQAQITLEEGWLEVEMLGEDQEIEQAISWLEEEGIEVEPSE